MQKVTVTSVAVATTKLVFGMCDIARVGHTNVRSNVSPGMDCES